MKMQGDRTVVVLAFCLLVLIAVAEASAQDRGRDVLFIKGGTILTMTRGVMEGGSILVRDGRIERIGRDIQPSPGAIVIDAAGKRVLPGFIVAQADPFGFKAFAKEDRDPVWADYADPYCLELRLCLASGITAYSPCPSLSRVAGQRGEKSYSFRNAVVKTAVGRLGEMVIREPAYLYIDIPTMTSSDKDELRGLLLKAREFLDRPAAQEKAKNGDPGGESDPPPDLKNYLAVLKKELPVRFAAHSRRDILKALSFIDEFHVAAQIYGGTEAWLLADEIAHRSAAVILQPGDLAAPDPYAAVPGGSNIRSGGILRDKGVACAFLPADISISTGGMLGSDLLTFPLAGALAVRGGLDEKTALEGLTIRAAELLGIQHRTGSLEEGKDADIIIMDGDPLDYRTYVETTIVNGRVLYEKSRSPIYKKIPKADKLL